MASDFAAARLNMVESQVRTNDVTDVRLHDAMRAIPRESLVPADRAFQAYETAVRADVRIPQDHHEDAAYAIWALGRGMAAMSASYPGGRLPPVLAERLNRGAAFLIERDEDRGALKG